MPTLKPSISPDSIIYVPKALENTIQIIKNKANDAAYRSQNTDVDSIQDSKITVFFFIPGNPGLISYYNKFLSLLSKSPEFSQRCIIIGLSLGGFETNVYTNQDHESSELLSSLSIPPSSSNTIYTLQDQINLTLHRVNTLTSILSPFPLNIILAGHSVGAYIALEVIRLHGSQIKRADIIAAILLTPTIADIAKSKSGRVATPLLTSAFMSFLPELSQFNARVFTSAFSDAWLKWIVHRATGMPYEDTSVDNKELSALDTTVSFLKSRQGVKQALRMARDEMVEIGEMREISREIGDVVKDEMDGEKGHETKLYLWFAEEDHWVASGTRDEIVKAMGSGDGKIGRTPTIVIDKTEGLVHAWCIKQNAIVVKRVIEWVEEVVERVKTGRGEHEVWNDRSP